MRRPQDVNSRIHDFIAKKTSQRPLCDSVADWLLSQVKPVTDSARHHYESVTWAQYDQLPRTHKI